MKLALLGNCAYQALVDDRATVRWLCWPRFDSSFVFGSLLDEAKGGELAVAPPGATLETEQRYLPNTNILATVIRSGEHAFEVVDFAPRFSQHDRLFKPTMLVRILRPLAGAPRVRVGCTPVYDYGRLEPRSYAASNHIQWELPDAMLRLTTDMPLSCVRAAEPFVLERTSYLVLTWGEPLEAPLAQTCESLLERTRDYWEQWVKHIALPGRAQREVIRSALALKLHQYEDTGAITAAATTSLPEHPGSGRTWDYRYCWLRDAYFTLSAMRRINHCEEIEGFVSYLLSIASGSPRHLQPVYGIGGEHVLREQVLEHLAGARGGGPVRVGNAAYAQVQNDVYGEMLAAIAPAFLDVRFEHLRSAHTTLLVRWLLERVSATLETPDAGPWEIRDTPKLHVFSLLMHWFGARVARRIGDSLGDGLLSAGAAACEARAHALIERAWREDLGHYGDSLGTDHADAALLMMVNLGYLRSDDPRRERHVRALASRLAAGGGLLHRYLHHDGIGDTRSAFTVCGFWHAEALARIGLVDEAAAAFEALAARANHVGLLSEDIDPQTGELWGNFPQTYSHAGLIHAAVALSPFAGE